MRPSPEADPDWPAPRWAVRGQHSPVVELLDRLPPRTRVVCGLTGIEMLLPIAYDALQPMSPARLAPLNWATEDYHRLGRAIIRAVQDCWGVLRGDVVLGETAAAALRGPLALPVHEYGPLPDLGRAAHSCVNALVQSEALVTRNASDVMYHVTHAATDSVTRELLGRPEWASPTRFLEEWWAICRARLAFRDAPTATISGPGLAPQDYESLRRHVDEPPSRHITSPEYQLLNVHQMPEGERPPTPGTPEIEHVFQNLTIAEASRCIEQAIDLVAPNILLAQDRFRGVFHEEMEEVVHGWQHKRAGGGYHWAEIARRAELVLTGIRGVADALTARAEILGEDVSDRLTPVSSALAAAQAIHLYALSQSSQSRSSTRRTQLFSAFDRAFESWYGGTPLGFEPAHADDLREQFMELWWARCLGSLMPRATRPDPIYTEIPGKPPVTGPGARKSRRSRQ